MRRIFAYTLFWFSMGMLFMLVLDNHLLGIIILISCLMASYYLFSCK